MCKGIKLCRSIFNEVKIAYLKTSSLDQIMNIDLNTMVGQMSLLFLVTAGSEKQL